MHDLVPACLREVEAVSVIHFGLLDLFNVVLSPERHGSQLHTNPQTFVNAICSDFPQCAFSNGGHLFAAVHGNVIQIYSTTTFECVTNLKGHNGKVRSIVWSADDSKIVSCGMDGAVYEWDSFSGKRIGESVLKSCSYTGVAVTPDGKTTFAAGSDKTLKEIADSQVL